MSPATTVSTCDEARELVDFLHKQAAYFRRHGGAALRHEADALANAAALLDSYRAGLMLVQPHPTMGAELIRWKSVSDDMPDAEMSVLIFIPAAESASGEDVIDMGWFDGMQWFAFSAVPLGTGVTHWAEPPTGPAATTTSAAEVPA